jgi:3-deoxy-D-manno-octulosonate 8-phosphate phosphatase (KDO 8-P phosphatase)
MDISERARKTKLLLMDCDGVLTDGRLFMSVGGESMKVFDVRDGQGLALWHAAGFESGIISGRGAGDIVHHRADELGVRFVRLKRWPLSVMTWAISKQLRWSVWESPYAML